MLPTHVATAKHTINDQRYSGYSYKLRPVDKTQKVALIGSTITATLSLVPATRLIASIALRIFSLISAASIFQNDRNAIQATKTNNIMNILKIAAIALSILAIITSAPLLLIPAISIDLAFQAFQLIHSASEDKPNGLKMFNHICMLTVNTLFLAAIAASSWPLMVSAAAVSIVAMIGFAVYAGIYARPNQSSDIIDTICYSVLALTGFTASITAVSMPYSKFLQLPLSGLTLATADEMGISNGIASPPKSTALPAPSAPASRFPNNDLKKPV